VSAGRVPRVFLIAGEESGDQLGAGLMGALRARRPNIELRGVGGTRMAGEGLISIFPMHDIAVMGIGAILGALPRILWRINQTVRAVLAARPDVLVLIDSPEFTHRVARRVRRHAPEISIVDYVSPSVWAWRPSRARTMRAYVDEVLALLPFEVEAHRRLGGPICDYVGHPLIEKLGLLRPRPGERVPLADAITPCLLILPGSRRSEVSRLMAPFGLTLEEIVRRHGPVEAIIPAVPHLAEAIREAIGSWPVKPKIVEGETEKFAAFRRAHAALAASGTVSLELALAGVPMAIAYRIEPLLRPLRFLVRVPSIVLANLILG